VKSEIREHGGELRADHDDRRFGVPHDVVDLGRCEPVVDDHRRRPDPGLGQQGLQGGRMVPSQEGDPAAGADPRLPERTGQAMDTVEKLGPGPGPAPVLEAQRDPDGLRDRPVLQ
jgi:hypothetical protein